MKSNVKGRTELEKVQLPTIFCFVKFFADNSKTAGSYMHVVISVADLTVYWLMSMRSRCPCLPIWPASLCATSRTSPRQRLME